MQKNIRGRDLCCPPFDPHPWDEKEHIWKGKFFIKDSNLCFMHFPLNMGMVLDRMWKKVLDVKAELPNNKYLILSKDVSPWKCEQYLAVTKEVEGAENVMLEGRFLSKVFEGPYKDVPKWLDEMKKFVKEKGEEAEDFYFFYTTCPKCAKEYGKNYVVVFAKVE